MSDKEKIKERRDYFTKYWHECIADIVKETDPAELKRILDSIPK